MSKIETITDVQPGVLKLRASENPVQTEATYQYQHLLPTFNNTQYPPLQPFEHQEPGLRALSHENPRSFLANATISDLSPGFGSEVRGVNLVTLDDNARDQLALEVARRGVLVFRDQEAFLNSDPEFWKTWGTHFGRLHIHPTSGHPEGHPEFHLVYKDADATLNHYREDSISTVSWHSDISYELQPPGLTTFFLLSQPDSGGDTLFTSQILALKKLSPQIIEFLRTLTALHSGVEQAQHARDGLYGGTLRRQPVEHVHPIVRRHPATGEEALYVNRGFTRKIIGLKREESDLLLNFLFEHIDRSADIQARVRWLPNTVVLWDNRITAHTAILDFIDTKERRHGLRITPQAERPIPAKDGLSL
ncbi:hypothetical protein DL96DRAFT_1669910 [Flagelloscypha sp. PMI_526]|nr:hypothetical protein DL96DRAFT_1669910 [Flagelloscypha sp. PMI_526]